MKTRFRESFEKDLKKVRDQKVKDAVKKVIEAAENSSSLSELGDVKKLKGTSGYYRIRIGNYRIGVEIKGNTIEFIRCLDRKEIYRYFP
ncbi:MAG: type II toxin-antitoxin system RelE/ParE family toxin [Rhizobacter sp.]|nr:type II toxin-antitoxin system RelE/ParE family toxin [Chlorobiales bacterium]